LVDLRIYRAALVPALLALVVVMFSLQERPRPLAATLAPEAFRGTAALADARRLAERYPARQAGSGGDAALGDLVESRFRGLGIETTRDRFTASSDGEEVSMSNVVGVLPGPSDRQVVLLAHRDAAGRPGASSAAATGALLELASALDGSSRRKTAVLVSADGGAADAAGARRFADSYADRDKVDAVVVLDDLSAASAHRPFVVPWSSDSRRGSLQVLRTADSALRREAATSAGSESWLGQFVRQAWPLTLREQGPLVRRGLEAVTLTASGELPRGPRGDGIERLSATRLESFGKAAFATVLALDGAAAIEESPSQYITVGRQVVPGWAFTLLAVGLALPALVTAVDAFARARRRGLPIGLWTRWVMAGSVPFAVTLAAGWLLEKAGALPATVSEALSPATTPPFRDAAPALAALGVVLVLSWLYLRPAAMGPARRLGSPGPAAAVAIALLLAIEALVVCLFNPFTALLIVPAAHFCLLATLPRSPSRPLLVAALAVGGLALPALALAYYGARLDLGLHPADYGLMLVTSATGSFGGAVVGSLVAGSLVSSVAVAFGWQEREPERPITVRGPVSYAGPGSLGGTESSLRH
jgi:hypothetical protein